MITLTWVILIFTKTVLSTNQNKNLYYLPENVTYAVRIDGRALAEKTLFSVFIESKDEEVLEMIRALFKQKAYKENEFRNAGIDYLSDILFFEMNLQSEPISGILFNVSNPGLFKKGLKNSSKSYACNGDVGVILFDNLSHPFGKEELTLHAEHILRNKTAAIRSMSMLHSQSGSCFEVFSKGSFVSIKSAYKQSNIHFDLDDRNIYVRGKLLLNKNNASGDTFLTKTLKPDGFHFSGTRLPALVSDTVNHWLKQFGCKLPFVTSVSMNLTGTKVINHSSGFFVVPQMDLFVETSSPIDIEKFLQNEKLRSYFDYQKDSNCIRIQEERLYFKQITETSFYLGKSASPDFISHSGKTILTMKGDVQSILKIEGSRLVSSFLEMIPEYRASKQLTEHVDKFDLSLRQSPVGPIIMRGSMTFKKGYYSINEIIRFLLLGEFIG